jgi:hypothetical protein
MEKINVFAALFSAAPVFGISCEQDSPRRKEEEKEASRRSNFTFSRPLSGR